MGHKLASIIVPSVKSGILPPKFASATFFGVYNYRQIAIPGYFL